MTAPTVVILAAGHGTRMRSAVPKVLHPLCGKPLVRWPVDAALAAGAARVIVVGGPDRALEAVLPEGVALAVQEQARGTGDAVRAAEDHIDRTAPVLVLQGDVPLITPEAIALLVQAHEGSDAAATMMTMELEDPAEYGRVVRARDGSVVRVVEAKGDGDAGIDELAIREVNTGVYAFDGEALLDALPKVSADNAQGEYYLPDVLPVLRAEGRMVAAHVVDDPGVALGVNDRVDLAGVRALAQQRIVDAHMRAGVTVVDPASTVIDVDVEIGRDTVVEPSTFLRGRTRIGEDCRIGPLSTISDASLGDRVSVLHSLLAGSRVGSEATIGPFSYLRPGAVIGERAKVGAFVEVKNSDIGAGAKVPHLSYVGDAEVGEETNLGAGTITANYDGREKHRTTIGRRVHGGVDTAFVAPVTVGDDAWTAAGSVVTEDVPPGALAIARQRQRNVEEYRGPKDG